ncbi:hypothetical protein [Streptomyces fradiae]|uniref:hypothetical protein n=1 Tax=Streptomyces fradiae TaxID=1906 RepID=UPI0039886970
MGAHAAPARHRRPRSRPRTGRGADRGAARRTTLSWAIPAALGAVYALYAGFLDRGASPTNWGDVVFGLVSGLVFGALCYGLGRVQRRLPREMRGAAYGALGGIAIGFLHNVSGASVLSSSVIGLLVGAGIGASAFYLFYTHE